jgi:hypothetical protein
MAAGMTTAVRDALASLARSFKRVSVYRHARDQHLAYLEPAVAELRSLLELKPAVTLNVEPTSLVFEGEVVHTEPARETGFCFRLHRDGVRSITFRRGLGVEELLALAYVAMADPQAEGGREDAVTELWKADFKSIGYSAGSGYRMDESAGDAMSIGVGEISGRVQQVLERHVGDSFMEVAQQPVLWTEVQRAKGDPQDYAALARRAALTILRIVEQDYAGWDLQALQESFWRLIAQLLEREQPQAIAQALDRLRRISGSHATEFRTAVGSWLSDAARLEQVVKIAGAEKPSLIGSWLELLPADAGPLVLSVLALGRDAPARQLIAAAAVKRIDSCAAQVPEVLRRGSVPEAQALLGALSALPPLRRAELANAAFDHPDPGVKLEAIPLVAGDPATAVKSLATALTAPTRPVRMAAAQAVAACGSLADAAAALMLQAMNRPQFAAADKDEQTLFYRSLGKLGAASGLTFLLERLDRPPKKLFGKKKVVDEQLLAVQGLAEDGSQKALRALEEALLPARGHPPAVVAACRAAAQHVRAGGSRGGRTG